MTVRIFVFVLRTRDSSTSPLMGHAHESALSQFMHDSVSVYPETVLVLLLLVPIQKKIEHYARIFRYFA